MFHEYERINDDWFTQKVASWALADQELIPVLFLFLRLTRCMDGAWLAMMAMQLLLNGDSNYYLNICSIL